MWSDAYNNRDTAPFYEAVNLRCICVWWFLLFLFVFADIYTFLIKYILFFLHCSIVYYKEKGGGFGVCVNSKRKWLVLSSSNSSNDDSSNIDGSIKWWSDNIN